MQKLRRPRVPEAEGLSEPEHDRKVPRFPPKSKNRSIRRCPICFASDAVNLSEMVRSSEFQGNLNSLPMMVYS